MTQAHQFDLSQLAPLPQELRGEIIAALNEAANARACGAEQRIIRATAQIQKLMAEVAELQKGESLRKLLARNRPTRGDRVVQDVLAKRAS